MVERRALLHRAGLGFAMPMMFVAVILLCIELGDISFQFWTMLRAPRIVALPLSVATVAVIGVGVVFGILAVLNMVLKDCRSFVGLTRGDS